MTTRMVLLLLLLLQRGHRELNRSRLIVWVIVGTKCIEMSHASLVVVVVVSHSSFLSLLVMEALKAYNILNHSSYQQTKFNNSTLSLIPIIY